MKKNTLFAAAATLVTVATISSCSGNAKTESTEQSTKSLIVYYSQTGATQQVATLLQQKVGADIEALELADPYNGDFQQTIARCQEEMGSGQTPELNPLAHQVADYDTIYIGYPVWFGTYAMPIATLVKEPALAGKVIVPFCTFGSGGLNTSAAQLAQALPQATILPGYGVRNARVAKASAELDQFLVSSGIVEGEAVQLPDFSEQQPVTPADQALFAEACSSYQMPLGSPVTVGSRALANGTEYLFTVESAAQDGSTQSAQIYVVKEAAEGAVAEFTQVVR